MAPAHPHATGVAVYPALFFSSALSTDHVYYFATGNSFPLEICACKWRFYCLILYFTAEREKRERDERARREKEQKEKEEKEKKEKEEEEKAEKERQEKLQKEAEERDKRKQRLEEIMRRTRRTDSPTSDQKVCPRRGKRMSSDTVCAVLVNVAACFFSVA